MLGRPKVFGCLWPYGQKIRLVTVRRHHLAELLADRRVGAVPRARWPRRGVRGSARGLARRRAWSFRRATRCRGVLTRAATSDSQDARDTSLNGLSDQGRNPPTAPSPPTDSIQGKSGPTGQRHLQGMPVPGAPEDTYLRSQDTYPHHRIPTPPLSGGIRGMGQPPCTWRSAPGPLAVRCQRHSDNHTPNHTGRVILGYWAPLRSLLRILLAHLHPPQPARHHGQPVLPHAT